MASREFSYYRKDIFMNPSPIASWRKQSMLYNLIGNHCTHCNAYYLPARKTCTCAQPNLVAYHFSSHGKIISYSLVTSSTHDFQNQGPLLIGLIELEHNVRIIGQITDTNLESLQTLMPVHGVLRKLYAHEDGIIQYGIKFIPPYL